MRLLKMLYSITAQKKRLLISTRYLLLNEKIPCSFHNFCPTYQSRIAKCKQRYTAYCLDQRHFARQGKTSSYHVHDRAQKSYARKCTGNQKWHSVKHFPTWRQRAMAMHAGLRGVPDNQTTYLLQPSMFKEQNYLSNHLSTILFYTILPSMLMYIDPELE